MAGAPGRAGRDLLAVEPHEPRCAVAAGERGERVEPLRLEHAPRAGLAFARVETGGRLGPDRLGDDALRQHLRGIDREQSPAPHRLRPDDEVG
ncbi:MAG: hypothetical protein ACKOBP_09100, partial [Planctomycetia bacterium]